VSLFLNVHKVKNYNIPKRRFGNNILWYNLTLCEFTEGGIIVNCIFCNEIIEEQILVESKSFKVVFDIDPIQLGHLLIISKSHLMDIREITTSKL
jgi:hypothetical protein